jgi:hypothetical protein
MELGGISEGLRAYNSNCQVLEKAQFSSVQGIRVSSETVKQSSQLVSE